MSQWWLTWISIWKGTVQKASIIIMSLKGQVRTRGTVVSSKVKRQTRQGCTTLKMKRRGKRKKKRANKKGRMSLRNSKSTSSRRHLLSLASI